MIPHIDAPSGPVRRDKMATSNRPRFALSINNAKEAASNANPHPRGFLVSETTICPLGSLPTLTQAPFEKLRLALLASLVSSCEISNMTRIAISTPFLSPWASF